MIRYIILFAISRFAVERGDCMQIVGKNAKTDSSNTFIYKIT
jgi:hypothetical protein